MAKNWPLESTKARVTLICLGMKNVLLCRSRKLSSKQEDVVIKEMQEMLEKLADEELKLMTLDPMCNELRAQSTLFINICMLTKVWS